METYENPLATRYASREMLRLFSTRNKIITWRKLWALLAKCERELGLSITQEQIDEMMNNLENIDWAEAEKNELETNHEVVAHILTFGKSAPKAMPIIHLGATSCYVTDNADVMIMKDAMKLIRLSLITTIKILSDFAMRYKDVPTLGLTHLQPAQPTTVGKRACLWINDFLMDLDELERRIDGLKTLGAKGATGTQASFLKLFGDKDKTLALDQMICDQLGLQPMPVTGQTYSRKQDVKVLQTLSGIGESASKFATDIRLLASMGEIEEPFGNKQVGSSAMAHKRNPILCERICGLSRYLMTLPINLSITHSTQWLERTLDDSSNRKITIPQAFLTTDAILRLCIKILNGLVVNEKTIEDDLRARLPFLMLEDILMENVKLGGDRQKLHEKIRECAHSIRGNQQNDLLHKLEDNGINIDCVKSMTMDELVGCAPLQVERFINNCVLPTIGRYGMSTATGKGNIT